MSAISAMERNYNETFEQVPVTDSSYKIKAMTYVATKPERAIFFATKILNKSMRHETVKMVAKFIKALHPEKIEFFFSSIVERDLVKKCEKEIEFPYSFTEGDFRIAAKALGLVKTDPQRALWLSQLIITTELREL